MMTMTYDPTADAIYVYLRQGVAVARTVEIGQDVNVDYGADGQPVGVELLNVSLGVRLESAVPQRDAIAHLIEGINGVRVFA